MPPEYPPRVLGNRVMSELKIAYWTAVNDTLVRLERKATKAALAKRPVNIRRCLTPWKSEARR